MEEEATKQAVTVEEEAARKAAEEEAARKAVEEEATKQAVEEEATIKPVEEEATKQARGTTKKDFQFSGRYRINH